MIKSSLEKQVLSLDNRQFLLLDAIIFILAPLLSAIIRLDDWEILGQYALGLVIATIVFLVIKLSIFITCNLYKHYWRYASIDELIQIGVLTIAAIFLEVLVFGLLEYIWSVRLIPSSLPLLDGILSFILVGGTRFSVRAIERNRQKNKQFYRRDRVLIVGAGNGGVSLLQEMQRSPQLGFKPIAFIDDDPQKLGLSIRGIPVAGNHYQIPEVVAANNIRQVIVAMPSAPGRIIKEVVDICQAIGVKTLTMPGINEILNHEVKLSTIRDIRIEDLLRREPIQTDTERVFKSIKGKTVLITGAGGSIGSEICRQVFRYCPSLIILMGHGENSIFNIQQELTQAIKVLDKNSSTDTIAPKLVAFIADMRFKSRMAHIFEQYRPEIVFHAAAHKHVPLMELNVPEAITNNVLGTQNLLSLAIDHNVSNFVMISTDKAVNPTNVMGASKRIAEMLVLQASQRTGKSFVVVRFGNVLGSRGSVVPTFQKQIARGGPITVTHPKVTRYFMTIPEAVQLVLQASVLSDHGQIFMLNMGQPVKIYDLAKDLIHLSGYEIDKDIQITFTGLRPGEKLYEELLVTGEEYEPTSHDKLLMVKNASQFIPNSLEIKVEILIKAAKENDFKLIIFLLEQLVSGYKPQSSHRKTLETKNSAIKAQEHQLQSSSIIPSSISIPMGKWEQELLQAFFKQELQLYYQPILELKTGEVTDLEALLRWQHPSLGLIAPFKFLAAAENTGVIVPISAWIVEEVCRQLQFWQHNYPQQRLCKVSINFSSIQLLQPSLVRHLKHCLETYNVSPHNLKLEVSEFLIREHPHTAMAIIPTLKELGVELTIDNFGRIGSQYNCCQPQALYKEFDRIKIDRYLINRIDKDPESLDLLKQMFDKVVDYGIPIIAVGVETKEQLDHIKVMNCQYAQGYLFHRPLKLPKLEQIFLKNYEIAS